MLSLETGNRKQPRIAYPTHQIYKVKINALLSRSWWFVYWKVAFLQEFWLPCPHVAFSLPKLLQNNCKNWRDESKTSGWQMYWIIIMHLPKRHLYHPHHPHDFLCPLETSSGGCHFSNPLFTKNISMTLIMLFSFSLCHRVGRGHLTHPTSPNWTPHSEQKFRYKLSHNHHIGRGHLGHQV